jgi:hypothetical protein
MSKGYTRKAEFDAVADVTRNACTPGTREDILRDLMAWAENSSDRRIYWMNGMAGTGKTTIAYSLCQELRRKRMLGASFFASRAGQETADHSHIFSTIAYQLACHSFPFRSALLTSLEDQEYSGPTGLHSQFTKLILHPAQSAKSFLNLHPLIVVCDGFDECRDLKQISTILSILIQHAFNIPIKFYISSRPEPDIIIRFSSNQHHKFQLHDVEKHYVREDIKIFLEQRFMDIRGEKSINDGWPSGDQLNRLLDLAGGLFIYAATVCLFVGSSRIQSSAGTCRALDVILLQRTSDKTGHGASYRELDALYHTVLASAGSENDRNVLKDVLCLIITTQTPLSQNAIAELLKKQTLSYFVESAVKSLQSVISVPHNDDQHIQIFHASFPDFLMDKKRSGENYLDPKQSHHFLAQKSLEYLRDSLLKDNICGLTKKNTHVSEANTSQLSQALQYGSIYWIFHFLEAKETSNLDGLVRNLLENLALRWIECMSLFGRLDIAVKMLKMLGNTQSVRDIF